MKTFSIVKFLVTLTSICMVIPGVTVYAATQQDCKQVCTKTGQECAQSERRCIQSRQDCAQSRKICVASQNQCLQQNTRGQCIAYQTVCTQYQDSCTQYRETCVQYQDVCIKMQNVCMQYQQVCSSTGTSGSMTDVKKAPPQMSCKACVDLRNQCYGACDKLNDLIEQNRCVDRCIKANPCVIGADCH
jgi:hypothetical protein